MILEEYEAAQLILYRNDDLDSMRKGMATFRGLLESGKSFEDGYCVTHFKNKGGPIAVSYFDRYPALKAYLTEMAYYYDDSTESDIGEKLTSEELFFLCAVIHPELKEDIIKTSEVIAKFANDLGDSSEMWLTCETAFGIGPLQIVAMQYPEYGYLMSTFLVANWDEEHMPFHLGALYQWVRHVGITGDSLKAFCYCNNTIARQQMFGYDIVETLFLADNPEVYKEFDLLTYFRETANGYDKFVEIFAKRCKESPAEDAMSSFFNGEGDFEEVIQTIVAEILIQHHPEIVYDEFSFDDFADKQFIDTSAKEAVQKLMVDIKNRL